MFCEVLPRRKATLVLHHYFQRCRHIRNAPLSSHGKFLHTALCRQLGVNQQKTQHEITLAERSVAPVSYRQQQTCNNGQAEDFPESLDKDVLRPLGRTEFPFTNLSTSKTSGSQKGESRKEKLGSHGSVKKAARHHSLMQPLKGPSQTELLRKVKLAEQLSPTDAASLPKQRAFKSCSFEQLAAVLQLLEEYHVSNERAVKVLIMNPSILSGSVDLLRQKLQVFVDFQIDEVTIGRLCVSGRALCVDVEALRKNLSFLEELGMSVEAKRKVLHNPTRGIAFRIEKFKRNLDCLTGMGVKREEILRLIPKYPQVLSVTCDNNFTSKYHFFQQIGIPATHLPRFICLASRISVDTLKTHMELIEGLGFSHEDVCLMVRKEPELLGYKLQKLKTKFDYLVHVKEYNMAEFVKYPKCLLASLESRIIPRCRLLEERGLSKVYSLATILSYSGPRFRALLNK